LIFIPAAAATKILVVGMRGKLGKEMGREE